MSKKCCGIIYKDEKFCTMCGKPLQDVLDMDEVEKIAASVLGEKGTAKEEEEVKTENKEEIKEESKEDIKEVEKATAEVAETVSENASEENNTEESPEAQRKDTPQKEENQENEEDDEDDEEEDDGTASVGLKFFGTLMILLMLASIALVGLGVYFIMLNPFYRNHDINNPVVYEQMSTDTDVTNIQTRPLLTSVSLEIATPEDSTTEEMATNSDATETDATETDATDEEASEDME